MQCTSRLIQERTVQMLVALMFAASVGAQPPQSPVGCLGRRDTGTVAPAPVVAEIRDPQWGARWLLLSDPCRPGGPGRLLREEDPLNRLAKPVIHVGDKIVVEERNLMSEVLLEGVALGPAAAGGALRVRLKLGGKVVRAVAFAPGSAALSPVEVQR